MSRICFIGLGNMGLPMAINLKNAGHDVVGFDVTDAAKKAAAEQGITCLETVPAAAADVDVIISMLPSGVHVRSVYAEIFASGIASSTLLIDSSTIDVESARDVAADATAKGFTMVDAPVSGGVGGAAAGTLTFMVGGTEEGFAAAQPYLDIMGKNIFHAGASGNGQAAKICNNMILGISMIAVSEGFALGERLGLDAQTLFDISSTASGQCWSMTSYCPAPGPVPTSPANNDYEPGFAASMMLKDLKLAQDAANKVGQPIPLGAEAGGLYQLMDRMGYGGKDFSGIIEMLRGTLKD